jgi:hypothetical protein
MDHFFFQPIRYFPRIEIRLLQYLSETQLTHAELNVVLEIISMSDFFNVMEGGNSLSLYMQNRFEVSKRLMNRYLQKIKELDLIRPILNDPKAFRGLPFLYNRGQFLNSLWEFDDVKTMTGWVFGKEFDEWRTNGDGSKTLHSPSYARLTKRQKSEKRISQSEHDKIVSDLKVEHTKDMNMLKMAFTEIIEENRIESQRIHNKLNSEIEKLQKVVEQLLSRVDMPSEIKDEVERHLKLVKNHD